MRYASPPIIKRMLEGRHRGFRRKGFALLLIEATLARAVYNHTLAETIAKAAHRAIINSSEK
jgi:hypothetical protein